MKLLALLSVFSILLAGTPTVFAADAPLATSVDELTTELMNAKPGDTILVGDISFQPMPMGMIIVPQNVTIKSDKDTNAVFTNATFALNGTTTDSAPLTVKFENIDFRGDQSGTPIDPNSPPLISSGMPDIMKTMCAAICNDCTVECYEVDGKTVCVTCAKEHHYKGIIWNSNDEAVEVDFSSEQEG